METRLRNFRQGFVGGLRIEADESLTQAPSVIAPFLNDVDLFPKGLADVGRVEGVITLAVKGQSPGITNTVSPNLRAGFLAVGKRIVLGNAVSLGSVDVDAQDFAQERVEVLSVAEVGPLAIIVAISSVAHTDVEKTLRSKGHPTSVVVAVGLVDLQAKDLRRRINSERLSWGCGELRDAQGAIPVGRGGRPAGSGVRDEHPMVLLELGVQD